MIHGIRIDMRLTDDHILLMFKNVLGLEPGSVTLEEIADKAGCHPNTVLRAVKRLQAAGRLKSTWQGFSKPCEYQVLEEAPPPP